MAKKKTTKKVKEEPKLPQPPFIHPNTGGDCGVGRHWDNVLGKCVLDGGG